MLSDTDLGGNSRAAEVSAITVEQGGRASFSVPLEDQQAVLYLERQD